MKEIEHERLKKPMKRTRKTKEETEVLENEYKKNENWSYELKCELAIKLGFTFARVSKWLWDRKKRRPSNRNNTKGKKK